MQAREFAIIEKKILPYLPGFVMKGKLLFISPVDDFLRGMYFNNASGKVNFTVEVLYMPLFIPQELIHFTHTSYTLRWNGNAGWRADDPNLLEKLLQAIQNDALPYLERVSTLRGVLELRRSDIVSRWPRVNWRRLEEFAYLLIKNGEYSAALEKLAHLKKWLAEDAFGGKTNQQNRVQLIEDKLHQSPEAALAQLQEWKAESITNLGLEKYYVPRDSQ